MNLCMVDVTHIDAAEAGEEAVLLGAQGDDAITAEQVASKAPTDRSICRVTMTNTMPVAMIATDTVWIVRLKMLRGVRNRPPVARSNAMQRIAKAPTIPNRRRSSSGTLRML